MSSEIHDFAQAYAVGALDDHDAALYAEHLEGCDACRREVAAMLDVTAALSDTVASEPPPALRAAVLEQITRTPQEPAKPVPATASPSPVGLPRGRTSSDQAHQTSTSAEQEGSNVVPMRRSRTTVVSSLVAAAAVVAAVAFGGMWLQTRQEVGDVTAQADQLTSLLSADDVRTVPGVSNDKAHTGAIVMSREQGQALFIASDLPPLPGDKVYEAWTIDGRSAPRPAGTFTPDTSRSLVNLPEAAFQADTMAITVEPAGGSDAPTSDAVVTFVMPQA